MKRNTKLDYIDPEVAKEAVSVSLVTQEIRVSVVPEYLGQHSKPENNIYVFGYTITIENTRLETIQLLDRHWVISSGGAEYMQVTGDGVVGAQPILESHTGFRYSSGTVIKDPFGSMHGWYTFKCLEESSNQLKVIIPKFDLIYPNLLH